MKNLKFPTSSSFLAGVFAAHLTASLPILALAAVPTPSVASSLDKPAAPMAGNGLTVERVSAEPDFDDRSTSLRWSPDGARVAWMLWQPIAPSTDAQTPQREIWTTESSAANQAGKNSILLLSAATVTKALQGKSAAPHRSLDDDDTNENPYLLREFVWFKSHNSLLLVGAQAIASFDLSTQKSHILVTGDDPVSGAALSPDEKTVSFLRDHKIWLVPAQGGTARLLTAAPAAGVLEGETDWDYRNELHLARGYQWSPDSTRIAYLETDDRAVAKYTIRTTDGDSREIAYPKPGGKLPLVRILIRRVTGGAPLEIHLGPTSNQYLPRIAWLPDGRHLAIERLDRLQHSLKLLLADSVTGNYTTLITENDEYWINLSDILYFFKDGKRFLWSSEKGGFRHLYLYDTKGHELAQITHGDWEVTKLNSVDEANSTLYFTATEKSPLERHLYQIHVDGTAQSRITQLPGTHEVFFAPAKLDFVDIHSSHTEPPQLSLQNVNQVPEQAASQQATGTNSSVDSAAKPEAPAAPAPRQSMTHHDEAPLAGKILDPSRGVTRNAANQGTLPPLQPVNFLPIHLHLGAQTSALLIRPPDFDPSHKYPVIFYLAGGPGEQLVRDAWGGATGLWMQLMAQKGFLVFALDNHGTTGRGHYFEHPIHLRLGAQELADQRDGLVYLSSLPYVDMTRLGVCGWGYGGFLVLHAMLDRPVSFKAGFAGEPIVDWRIYDATFAERYLDDTVHHADGWLASLAFDNDSPKFFKGKLMIAQSTGDEFVHMENAFLIQDQMLKAGRSADLLLFPDSGHFIESGPARLVLFQKMTDFFVMNL